MYNNLFLNKETPLLAVDIGSQSITIGQLKVKNNVCELVAIGIMPISKGSVIDGLVEDSDEVLEAIKQIIKKENFTSKYVVSSIPGDLGVIRKLTLTARNRKQLIEKLLPEVQHEIPFDLEDVRYDYHIVEHVDKALGDTGREVFSEENSFDVVIAAVQQEIIDNRYDILVEAGLNPVIFELETFASIRSLQFIKDQSSVGPCALFNLNDPYSHVSIVNNGQLAFNKKNPVLHHCSTSWEKSISMGFFRRTNKIKDYFNNKINKEFQSDEKIGTKKRLTTKELDLDLVRKIIDETSEAIGIFSKSTNQNVKCLFIHGIGALASGIQSHISEHFKIPVERINPFSAIKVDPKRFHLKDLNDLGPQFAVVMGLALRRFNYK